MKACILYLLSQSPPQQQYPVFFIWYYFLILSEIMMWVKTSIVASFCFLITFRVGTLRNRAFLHFIDQEEDYFILFIVPPIIRNWIHNWLHRCCTEEEEGWRGTHVSHPHPAKIMTLTMPLTGLYGRQATLPDIVCRKLTHESNWCLR